MWHDQIWCIDSIMSAILLAAMIIIVGISHFSSNDKDVFHQADDEDNLSKKNV